MEYKTAAIWGTSVGYSLSNDTVMIEKIDGTIGSISRKIFDYLYLRLDDYTASLKEDCIRYIENPDYITVINYMGGIRHMDSDKFNKIYDTVRE